MTRRRRISAVELLGRGVASPFRFEDGGVAWNLPADPTPAQQVAAAEEEFEEIATSRPAETAGDRQYGVGLEAILETNALPSQVDATERAVEEAVRLYMPYVELAAASGEINDAGDKVRLLLLWNLTDDVGLETRVSAFTAGSGDSR